MRRSSAVVAPRSPALALHDLETVEDGDDLVPGGYLDGVALTGTDLSGAEVECLALRRCMLGYLNLRGSVLSDLSLEGCTVEEVDLTDATVRRLALTGCRVDVVDLAVASAQDLDLRGSDVSALDGVRPLDGVVLDEDQARWFGPLLAATLGGRVL